MNIKNISIILALLSFEVKVFSSPIRDIISEEEVSALETSNVEFSDDAIEILNVDSVLEDAIDSELENSEVPTETEIPLNDNEDIGDLICDDFYSCMNWIKDYKSLIGLSDEIIQYMTAQYEAGVSTEFIKDYKAINYGKKVEVNGHQMTVDIQGEDNDKTIVILTGLGSPSPILYYKPIADSLSAYFKVITVEPFGYGLSDQTSEERTVENMVTEIHTCLEKLGINEYYLMGHSISGIYSLVFDDKYPDEVLGFIGLDNTPNHYDSSQMSPYPEIVMTFVKIAYKYQFAELYPEELKTELLVMMDSIKMYLNYSEEDLKNIVTILKYTNYSPSVFDETNHVIENMAYTYNMQFHCPVLMFVASATDEIEPEWEALHKEMITNPQTSEIVKLDGMHAFLHAQKTEEITEKIKEWIN